MIITKVNPMSCARIAAFLYAIIGFLGGVLVALGSLMGGFASQSRSVFPAVLGLGSVVIFPLLYGAIGFVITYLSAWAYNFLAGVVGGIEIEVR